MTEKALIYCRVSSKSQETDGHGLDSQETRCRDYAAAKGYHIEGVFPDTASGGGDFMKRPGMVAMLAYMDAFPQENFIVVFDDVKRYARDVEFHIRLRKEMEARGAIRECLNFRFDSSPEGRFNENIMAASGQLEREQNGLQVSQKMRVRIHHGYWCHLNPPGYVYADVPGHGRMMVRDEPLASIVQEMLEGYASGRFQTKAECQRWLQDQPLFPRGKSGRVTVERVTTLLTQPLYAGYINSEVYGVAWLKAQHEPLISLETMKRFRRGAPARPEHRSAPISAMPLLCAASPSAQAVRHRYARHIPADATASSTHITYVIQRVAIITEKAFAATNWRAMSVL